MKTILRVGLLLCTLVDCGWGGQWPQFRGPGGQGHAGNVQLPVRWSETSGLLWKTPIPGRGHSSPVHDGRFCWLTTASRDGRKLGAVSVDLETGQLVHNVVVFDPRQVEPIHPDNSYASPTPVLRESRLFVHYGTYGTACIDTATGEVLWRNTDFALEHQGGPGSSPVLFNDLLILTLDGADTQRVVALDVEDGSVRWQRARSAPMRTNPITHRSFSTPLIVPHQGAFQLISPSADQCHAYDPATGKELWHVRYVGFSTVPCPVSSESTVYFCTGFFRPQLWSIDLAGIGDVTGSHVRWTFRGQVPETPSPLLVEGRIYTISNRGVATCIDAATGERLWVLRVGGNYSASPCFASGLIYLCNHEGQTKILDIRGEKPRILQVDQLDGGIMASPAVIGSDLLIRTDRALYRIGGERVEDPQ
jgi:outer membrane protein assembly factor BamB